MKMYMTVETNPKDTSVASAITHMVVDVQDQKHADMIAARWENRGYVVTWVVIGD